MQAGKTTITRIDFAGAGAVLLGMAVGVWFGALQPDSARAALTVLRRDQSDMQARHSRMQKLVQHTNATWKDLHDVARREGKLDRQLPIEDRLQAIRTSVGGFGWEDLQIRPLAEIHAGDVEEKTFHLTAVAHYAQVIAFLEGFEGSPAWADISHVMVEVGPSRRGAGTELCRIGLTFNFYSARQSEI